ncbi:MAG TPA: OmpH family outer membrane protein [Pyrinomonadaceae bacterium]|nr:OmpH family outer membrane protein [Pyrinomonadaceae bacterium]
MKLVRFTAAVAALGALLTVNALAQTPAAPRPATQQPARPAAAAAVKPSLEGKIAVIQTEFFMHESEGIRRIIAAMQGVDREFQPRRTEIQQLETRYNALVKEINDTKSVADQATLTRKADEAETIKKSIDRKREDGQRDLQKRMGEVLQPLQSDVYKALDAYAKERGIAIIIDASQVPLLYATETVDITRDFIGIYNQRNAAAATTPAAPRTN